MMIETNDEGVFFLSNAFRLHGSAAFRATVPAAFSTLILVLIVVPLDNSLQYNDEERWVMHPYVIQALVMGLTFIITFRANFAYGRYWEGATAVHQMLSKWLDVGMVLAAFHYQSVHFDKTRPPSFGDHPQAEGTRDRERLHEMTQSEYLATLPEEETSTKSGSKLLSFFRRRNRQIQTGTGGARHSINASQRQRGLPPRTRTTTTHKRLPETTHPDEFHKPLRGTADLSSLVQQDDQQQQPTLFLQESAHLLSLLSAVAMSTLRNDVERAESPLVEYYPGEPWPPADPDKLSPQIRAEFREESRFWTVVYFLLGLDRSPRNVTLYNAARPLRVLGGVSDQEIAQLQRARGPEAKVGLCTMWLQEYIAREHQCGSTDGIHAALMSRVFQFTSDGMIGYNQSRKIAYMPFPFPHEQGTIMVLFMLIAVFPVLYYSFVNNLAMACALNFVTVLCFVGLHEVARELENPFWNYPNDLPLITFQAQFNEALLTTYFGFEPDSYWTPPGKKQQQQAEHEHEQANDTPSLKEE